MRRTTIYLAPELEVLLKSEMLRQNRPMAEIVREAVEAYLTREPRQPPPGAGAFASGHEDTAERANAVLAETRFGETSQVTSTRTMPNKFGGRASARKRPRR